MASSPSAEGLRVALDVQACLGRLTGIGWYATLLVRSLLARLGPERYRLVVSGYRTTPVLPFGNPRGEPLVLRTPTLSSRWPVALQVAAFRRRYRSLMPRALAASGAAVVHGLNYFVPPPGPYRRVATVHDVDFISHPERQTRANQVLFRRLVTPELPGLDAVLVPSRATRDRLLSLVPVQPGRVHVVPEAVDPAYFDPVSERRIAQFRLDRGLPPRYALFVGTIEPRKNLETAVRAVAACRRPEDLALVVVGAPGWGAVDPLRTAAQLGAAHRVRCVGYVPRDELPLFYRAAQVFLLPSLDEGFGLPLVEAMACGTPAICSDRGSLPEVAGGAALVAAADSAEAWTRAIERVLADQRLRARLRGAGLRRARARTWDDAAGETLAVYRSLS